MIKKTPYNGNSYLPVAWEYRESIVEQIQSKNKGKIFYFAEDNKLEEAEGIVVKLAEQKAGEFITMDNGHQIRIDRIITLFGKIGASYEEYDAYANACMDCSGGYSKEELDNM